MIHDTRHHWVGGGGGNIILYVALGGSLNKYRSTTVRKVGTTTGRHSSKAAAALQIFIPATRLFTHYVMVPWPFSHTPIVRLSAKACIPLVKSPLANLRKVPSVTHG